MSYWLFSILERYRKEALFMNNLFQILGELTYAYSRIYFLISNIAFDVGITPSVYSFFAIPQFDKKINLLKSAIQENGNMSLDLKSEFVKWIEELNELRELRNTILHSLILGSAKDEGDYMFFNYRISKEKELVRSHNHYNIENLETIKNNFIKLHNDGYIAWRQMKQ